ncbi:MAG: DUF1854 domain-containing protein [Lachnospiraceae bacterium]|nr:DUF1854 domain-containing protein [Lachnospiraceae bacterium]MBR6999310.1 DUF1854 domain-containing protein [Lachnospiraceae bacterium]MCR5530845.1 DUF1854 domain-containing protein [Lachnospiraceae bacterium]
MGFKQFEGADEEFNLEQMEAETEQMLRLRYINKDNAVFARTAGGFVSLDLNESIAPEHYDRIRVVRSFPFTDRDKYISIRTIDEKSKEIGMIKDLSTDVTPETRQMLEEQMDIRYFTPVIKKINSIKDEYGHAYFDVETDQGPCKFVIYMNSSSVVNLSDVRLLISDLDGNRFEIPDYTKLSARELKMLDLFL